MNKLEKFLDNCKKIVLVGIGNPLSAIDSIGLDICDYIKKVFPNLEVEMALNTPENVLSKFLDSNHTHILVVDAIDAGLPVGTIVFLEPSEVAVETETTHTVPIGLMLKALESEGKRTLILGVQISESRMFNKNEIQKIFDSIVGVINSVLKKCKG